MPDAARKEVRRPIDVVMMMFRSHALCFMLYARLAHNPLRECVNENLAYRIPSNSWAELADELRAAATGMPQARGWARSYTSSRRDASTPV
ncbi:hypothetical protein RHECNPAF_750075 [Rhizobium etli CNPAF512]|nr:hypothetical protein RHECNPAF_750075 [Rhizobium etli CNPAF512]